jgi:hypothetical protein
LRVSTVDRRHRWLEISGMRCAGMRDDGQVGIRAARCRAHGALLVWITVVLLAVSIAG